MADDGFAAFYAGSYRRLLGQLFAVTGDLAEAENVLQEAYARAFVRWSRVGAYDLPEAWVRRVAVGGVARVTYESPAEAYRGLPERLRREGADPASPIPRYSPEMMPGAFRVALDDPARAGDVHLALCGSRTTGECPAGLVVLEHPRKR
jgi:hypothetical protein